MNDSLLSFDIRLDGAWFRVFGWGLSVRVRGTYMPLFSERERMQPRVDVGPLRFMVLTPVGPR